MGSGFKTDFLVQILMAGQPFVPVVVQLNLLLLRIVYLIITFFLQTLMVAQLCVCKLEATLLLTILHLQIT